MIEITVRSCLAARCRDLLRPLYEIQDEKWIINCDPRDREKPITDWLKPQGRFKRLFALGYEALLAQFQKLVDDDWESFKKLQEMSKS